MCRRRRTNGKRAAHALAPCLIQKDAHGRNEGRYRFEDQRVAGAEHRVDRASASLSRQTHGAPNKPFTPVVQQLFRLPKPGGGTGGKDQRGKTVLAFLTHNAPVLPMAQTPCAQPRAFPLRL